QYPRAGRSNFRRTTISTKIMKDSIHILLIRAARSARTATARRVPPHRRILTMSLTLLAAVVLLAGCGNDGGKSGNASSPKATIQDKGSDTMVNLAQAWAEEYKKVAPDVDVEVSGGGSGVGIAALIKGTIDIANASRNMKPEEIEQAKKNTGKEPK